jgi:predicted SAM-dependent methyltransferase
MKLNICCGKDYREGYTNIDFSKVASDGSPLKVDLEWNLLGDSYPLLLTANCADEIVFRESLEHFNRHNGLKVLGKLHFLLKPGGVLDLSVPNATKQMKILMQMMMNPAPVSFKDFEEAHERFTYWKWHDDLMGATHASDGNDGDSHKTLYTKQTLKPILEYVGFKVLSIDDNIFAKATK